MEEQKPKIRHGTPNNLDTKAAVEALEYLLAAGYVSKKRLYFANFMRGIFFSLGTIVGIALVSTLIISILSQFDDARLVKDVKTSIEKSIQVKQSTSEQ
jgi:hypothetical protein